jgi:uracil-DNA glycosylase family 4
MGIDPTFMAPEGWHAALAALEWQIDLGVTEITGEDPLDRYALPDTLKAAAVVPAVKPVQQVALTDPVAVAQSAAAQAGTLDELRDALNAFDLCDLKRGARSTVFADGNPAARVLVLGDQPGRDDDAEGRPFVGRAGQLFDRMFATIGLSRTSADPETALYVTNALPWRTPQNRDPEPEEIAMMRPFVLRHIELVNPAVIIAMGNAPCLCLLGTMGVLRLRGTWAQAIGRPVLPMTDPAFLLRNPAAKREAWADLLALKGRLG